MIRNGVKRQFYVAGFIDNVLFSCQENHFQSGNLLNGYPLKKKFEIIRKKGVSSGL